MTYLMPGYRQSRTALACLAFGGLVAACGDATPPVAVEATPGHPVVAKGGSSASAPTGRARTRDAAKGASRHQIQYHGGPLMLGGVNVYLIWYGWWEGSATPPILVDFVSNLGESPYFAINTLYSDATGARPLNRVTFSGSIGDMYSHEAALSEADVRGIVARAINLEQLPNDPSGIYFVFGSADVTLEPGFCTQFCGFHGHTNVGGNTVKYAFVGSPARCPAQCAEQAVGPNGTLEADAMVNVVANLLSATVTDPLLSAWYDRAGLENAEKCAWDFGLTYTAPNGAQANIQLGARHFLLQRNWVLTRKGGSCAMAAPSASALSAEDASAEGE